MKNKQPPPDKLLPRGIKVSQVEWDQWRRWATKSGVDSISAWLKLLARREGRRLDNERK